MRFDNCADCGKYKYLEDNGVCPTCSDQSSVRIRLDIIDESLRSPDMLRTIADVIQSVSGVECDGSKSFNGEKHDDLDLKEDFCRLFEAESKFNYEDYKGDRDQKVRKAIVDALKKAREEYS